MDRSMYCFREEAAILLSVEFRAVVTGYVWLGKCNLTILVVLDLRQCIYLRLRNPDSTLRVLATSYTNFYQSQVTTFARALTRPRESVPIICAQSHSSTPLNRMRNDLARRSINALKTATGKDTTRCYRYLVAALLTSWSRRFGYLRAALAHSASLDFDSLALI
jgi:hypothetical protein